MLTSVSSPTFSHKKIIRPYVVLAAVNKELEELVESLPADREESDVIVDYLYDFLGEQLCPCPLFAPGWLAAHLCASFAEVLPRVQAVAVTGCDELLSTLCKLLKLSQWDAALIEAVCTTVLRLAERVILPPSGLSDLTAVAKTIHTEIELLDHYKRAIVVVKKLIDSNFSIDSSMPEELIARELYRRLESGSGWDTITKILSHLESRPVDRIREMLPLGVSCVLLGAGRSEVVKAGLAFITKCLSSESGPSIVRTLEGLRLERASMAVCSPASTVLALLFATLMKIAREQSHAALVWLDGDDMAWLSEQYATAMSARLDEKVRLLSATTLLLNASPEYRHMFESRVVDHGKGILRLISSVQSQWAIMLQDVIKMCVSLLSVLSRTKEAVEMILNEGGLTFLSFAASRVGGGLDMAAKLVQLLPCSVVLDTSIPAPTPFNTDCCLCMEDLPSDAQVVVTFSCRHALHRACAVKLMVNSDRRTCPYCVQPFV